jgi:hypothetical protein
MIPSFARVPFIAETNLGVPCMEIIYIHVSKTKLAHTFFYIISIYNMEVTTP